jgi:hypothetical protein
MRCERAYNSTERNNEMFRIRENWTELSGRVPFELIVAIFTSHDATQFNSSVERSFAM